MTESVQSTKAKILESLFHGYEGPPFSIRLWDGWSWQVHARGESVCTIVFHSAEALQSLLVRPSEITLGEAYLSKEIDVEGDLLSAFAMAEHIFQRPEGERQKLREMMAGLLFGIGRWLKRERTHSLEADRTAISYHYDQPVGFYKPWLGESLAYSCAYFRSDDDDIDAAQKNKLELICRKLRLAPRENFLDIGCGWGSLILHAASHHKVSAHGITISREQAAVAEGRIANAGLMQSCKVELLDYRQAPGELAAFDKIASVGMFEHVGLKNLPLYFQTVRKLLRPGGVFLNHGIARSSGYAGNASFLDRAVVPFLYDAFHLGCPRRSSFIDKYVFPDGELVTLSQALQAAESAGFEVRDVENLREHYELTLRCWVEALQRNAHTVLKHVSETTYRIWLLYMAGCAAAFHRGEISIYQTILSHLDHGNSRLPRTREDWYLSRLPVRTGMPTGLPQRRSAGAYFQPSACVARGLTLSPTTLRRDEEDEHERSRPDP